jgi:hypothetical protein
MQAIAYMEQSNASGVGTSTLVGASLLEQVPTLIEEFPRL